MDDKNIITVPGLVLKEYRLNEADELVTILTADMGRVTVLARGVKKITSKRSPGLKLFAYSDFEFEKKGEKLSFVDSSPIAFFENIVNDLDVFAIASYICEVACECSVENISEDMLLRLCLNCLFALDKRLKSAHVIKAVFELKAACLLGFMPNVEYCVISGKKIPDGAKNLAFSATEGGFITEECFEEAQNNIPDCFYVPGNVFSVFRRVVNSDQKKMLSFELDDASLRQFCSVCQSYFLEKTEKRFNSLSFYKKKLKN